MKKRTFASGSERKTLNSLSLRTSTRSWTLLRKSLYADSIWLTRLLTTRREGSRRKMTTRRLLLQPHLSKITFRLVFIRSTVLDVYSCLLAKKRYLLKEIRHNKVRFGLKIKTLYLCRDYAQSLRALIV